MQQFYNNNNNNNNNNNTNFRLLSKRDEPTLKRF